MWELFTGAHAFKGVPRALLGHEVAYQQLRPQFPEGCPFDYQLLACRRARAAAAAGRVPRKGGEGPEAATAPPH